ncbi:MAG: hypothetical protein QF395_03855, partial [Arenicellales bacterium]|nr:hypothetical protein [Arenicellales bacterium]
MAKGKTGRYPRAQLLAGLTGAWIQGRATTVERSGRRHNLNRRRLQLLREPVPVLHPPPNEPHLPLQVRPIRHHHPNAPRPTGADTTPPPNQQLRA